MKKDKLLPLFVALGLAVLFLAAFVPQGSFIYQYAPMQAVFPSASYYITQTATSNAVDLGKYGAIQVQTSVTATGVTTVTPQFSNELVPCSAVLVWVDATEQFVYAHENLTPTLSSVSLAWQLATDGADNRELPALGRCFRLKVVSDGATFVPAGYLRLLQRN